MKRYSARLNRTKKTSDENLKGGSTVTLKDLCRQDKDRVKKLVEDLAIMGTEKEEIDQIRKQEKFDYERKLYCLQKKQVKLAEEKKAIEDSLRKYKQELDKPHSLATTVQSKSPNNEPDPGTGPSTTQPFVRHSYNNTTFAPPTINPQPWQQTPPTIPSYPYHNSTMPTMNRFVPQGLATYPYTAPPPLINNPIQVPPPLPSYIPQYPIRPYQYPYMASTMPLNQPQSTDMNINEPSSAHAVQQVSNTQQASTSIPINPDPKPVLPDSIPCPRSNTTWCTLPETEATTTSIPDDTIEEHILETHVDATPKVDSTPRVSTPTTHSMKDQYNVHNIGLSRATEVITLSHNRTTLGQQQVKCGGKTSPLSYQEPSAGLATPPPPAVVDEVYELVQGRPLLCQCHTKKSSYDGGGRNNMATTVPMETAAIQTVGTRPALNDKGSTTRNPHVFSLPDAMQTADSGRPDTTNVADDKSLNIANTSQGKKLKVSFSPEKGIRVQLEERQPVLPPPTQCCEPNDTELLSEILNQTPPAAMVGLEGLSVSLIDSTDDGSMNYTSHYDNGEEQIIQEIFYI